MHNPRAGIGPRTCYIRPSEQVYRHKKFLLSDGDYRNEFNFIQLFYSFAGYYDPKQL